MAAYIDTADVDAVIGSAERQALFDDTGVRDGSNYSSTLFDRQVELASSIVRGAVISGTGTDPGESTTNDLIKSATIGALLQMAYERRKLEPPEALLAFLGGLPEAIRSGQIEIPGFAIDEGNGPGGSVWTSDATSSTGVRQPVFNRKKLRDSF